MKKLVLLGALALAPILAQAQYSNYPNVIPFAGVPSGACAQSQLAVNTSNGNLYSCSSASWTAVGTSLPALTDNGTNVISTEGFLAPIGTTTVPAYSFTGNTNFGLNFINGQNEMAFDISGNYRFGIVNSEIRAGATSCFTFSSNNDPTATNSDIALCRDAAVGTLAVKAGPSATADMKFRVYGSNGGFVEYGASSELLTLSTVGTTTDTTGNLLPANSIIDAVDGRVTTTITTATSWQLGDATTPGRFSAVNSTMTAGSTQVGDVQADQTGAAGPRQVAAAKVRVTTVGTPGAGVIRITVHYHSFTPPTS